MAPTIHLIRHAEGVHNISVDNHGIHDPLLTDRGRQQARDLGTKIAMLQQDGTVDIGLILASPLRRTLTTALMAFEPQLQRNQPGCIYAWPDVQEVSDIPCDSGSTLSVIKGEYDSKVINFSLVEEGWQIKQRKYAPTEKALLTRAQVARNWLKEQPYKDIAVISHGCFLHFLTDDWEGSNCPNATNWEKTEMRSFNIIDTADGDAVLVETAQSRTSRGCARSPPSREVQRKLRDDTLSIWMDWEILKA